MMIYPMNSMTASELLALEQAAEYLVMRKPKLVGALRGIIYKFAPTPVVIHGAKEHEFTVCLRCTSPSPCEAAKRCSRNPDHYEKEDT